MLLIARVVINEDHASRDVAPKIDDQERGAHCLFSLLIFKKYNAKFAQFTGYRLTNHPIYDKSKCPLLAIKRQFNDIPKYVRFHSLCERHICELEITGKIFIG